MRPEALAEFGAAEDAGRAVAMLAGLGVTLRLVADAAESEALERQIARLPSEERGRAEATRHAGRRSAFVAGRVTARDMLGPWGHPAPAIEVDRFGRPHVTGRPEIRLAISHSRGVTAVAIACGRALGLDLEVVPQEPGWQPPLEALDAFERDWLERRPPASRLEDFFALWTLKEAIVKAGGLGAAAGLPVIELATEAAAGVPALVGADGLEIRSWTLTAHGRIVRLAVALGAAPS